MIDPHSASFKAKLSFAYKGIRAEYEKMNLSPEEVTRETELTVIELIANYAKMDFFFFMDAIMDCEGMSHKFHGELCDFMKESHDQKLILAPRGHLKSTVCTVGYALWRVVQNPNIRILIANYKLSNAEAFLSQMRGAFLMNDLLKAHFPKVIPDVKKAKWNQSQITVNRTQNHKEATIEVAGVGSEITGRHYDLIIYDDIVGPENITTKEQIDKLKAWYNQTQFLLEPGGDQVMIGTRWHFDDLYGWIIQNLDNYKVFKRGIYGVDGLPVWPEKFTTAVIEKIKGQMERDPRGGKALFVAQYLNEVMDEETAFFKRVFLKRFTEAELPSRLGVTITVDPAISERETADFSAMTVRGIDEDHKWFILDAWHKRGVSPKDLIDKIFELYVKWRDLGYTIDGVAVESVAYQKSLQYHIREEMFKRGVFMPLQELKYSNTSKEYRIKGLINLYENGALLFREAAEDDTSDLLDEMFRFPRTVHDDLLDSVAMHAEIYAAPSARRGGKEKAESYGRDRYGYPEEKKGSSYGFSY